MIINARNLKRGCVEIKSYDRKECMDKGESLIIIHQGKKMTLSPVHVKVKIKAKSALIKSKIGTENHYLYSYKWNPDINQE